MANLKTCKDCGHQISKNATQCPNCGAKIKKTSILGWLALIFIGIPVLMAVIGSFSKDDKKEVSKIATTDTAQSPKVNSDKATSSTVITATPVSTDNWKYSTEEDKMRNTKIYVADSTSTNSANFKFPYNGESHLHIILRNQNNKNDVIFTIDKGQYDCGISGCTVAIKFDNEPVKKYAVNEAGGGVATAVFLASDKENFIKKLKTANKVTIEPRFYQEGTEQFEFNVQGLNWKY